MNPSSPQRRLNSGEWRLLPGPGPATKVPASSSRAEEPAHPRAQRLDRLGQRGELETEALGHGGLSARWLRPGQEAIVTKGARCSKRGCAVIEMLLMELPEERVRQIAGPSAIWLPMDRATLTSVERQTLVANPNVNPPRTKRYSSAT